MTTLPRSTVTSLVRDYLWPEDRSAESLVWWTEFFNFHCPPPLLGDANTEGLVTRRSETIEHLIGQADPRTQARMVFDLLEAYPVDHSAAPPTRTHELHDALYMAAASLVETDWVPTPVLAPWASRARQALVETERLLSSEGPARAVDRAHLALAEYFHAALEQVGEKRTSKKLHELWGSVRSEHPAFEVESDKERKDILRDFANVLHRLNQLRNENSAAHPNDDLDEPEAMLAIHAARTILHYVDARIRAHEATP